MRNKSLSVSLFFFMLYALIGCNSNTPTNTEQNTAIDSVALLHNTVQKITDVVIIDVFNPPVSSRIYAYTSLAAYEAIKFIDTSAASITKQLKGFDEMPLPDASKKYFYPLSAVQAMLSVAEKVTFSTDSLKQYRQQVISQIKNAGIAEDIITNSLAFGDTIAKTILKRADKDNYKQTRAMEKYQLTKQPGKWQPTPPEYADAMEPNWSKMLPLLMDSASAFRPAAPMQYSKDSSSIFYKQLMEVYKLGDGSDTTLHHIAWFWDDNAFVTGYSGHLTSSSKKMTPAGHWMAIAGLAAQLNKAGTVATSKAYALTAVALFDGFISCWEEKYHSQTIRPVTLINQWINPDWKPLLQTPPFPEYTSGHSVVSASAAEILTALFGDNFPFTDITELPYDRGQRSFKSFREAALEASISRLYGGIHYRYSLEQGNLQGMKIGQNILSKVYPSNTSIIK